MIRKASIKDLSQVMLIVEQTLVNMKIWDNKQWDVNYPTSETFKVDISKTNLYVYESNNIVAGFITIDKHDPEAYSGLNWTSSDDHLIFHRFAIHNEYKGKGIAYELLSFGQSTAVKSNVNYLRIDTNSKNIPMNNLLTKFGFKEVDRVKFRNVPDEFICYDKLLTEV